MEGSAGKSGGKGGDEKPVSKPKAAKAKAPAKSRAAAKAKPRGRATQPKAGAGAKPRSPAKPKQAAKAKQASKAKAAKTKQAAKPAGKPADEPSRDLWFRFSTRVRAGGYWLREKGQWLGKHARSAGESATDFWLARSTRVRIAIATGGVLLALILLIRIVPVPGVPCRLSVRECAPDQQSLGLVPADALLYGHLTLDRDSEQFEQASEAFDQLADLRSILTTELPPALPTPSGTPIDVAQDVLPWAERDLAVTQLPGKGKSSLTAFIAGVGDREGAEEFISKVAPSGQAKEAKQGNSELTVHAGGFAEAFVGDSLVFGDEAAVRAALGAEDGSVEALEESDEGDVLDDLPDARFAEVYLSRSGVQRLLAGRPGAATQLETFVDYGATDGVAAAAVAQSDGVEVELVSSLDPELLAKNPSFFSELPSFEPDLSQEAGSRSLAYAGVGEVGPTLVDLLERAGGAGGVAGSARALSARLGKEAGVDLLQQLLPALGGQAALVAEPTDGVPFASLIVDGVDSDEANEALAALQKPLIRALGTSGGSQVPSFEESEVEGVTVRSVQASPTVNLSYAVFDGVLVVSTDPAGIAQVKAGGEGLADSEPYERATAELPDSVSALVFLNLDELFGQVTRTDLVEDPFFANLSVLFDNATSVALAVNAGDEEIRSELFLAIDH